MLKTPTIANQIPTQARPTPWNPMVSFGRYWQWSVPTGIVLAIVAAYAAMQTFEPRYRAAHLLEKPAGYALFPGVFPAPASLDLDKEKDLLFSANVLDPVLADPKLRTTSSLADPNRAEANLRKNLSMESFGTSFRIIICYQDNDPVAAAMVCNAIVDSYLRQRDANEINRLNILTRWLEPEIQHWESKVEQGRAKVNEMIKISGGRQVTRDSAKRWESESVFIKQLLSQAIELSFQIALLNARIQQDEHLTQVKSTEVDSLPDPKRARLAKEMERERDGIVVELEDLNDKILDEQSRLGPFWHLLPELQNASDELQIATDVRKKLKSRASDIHNEYTHDDALRTLAPATPPRDPINSSLQRTAVFSGVAFLSPLMLGFLLGFKRDTESDESHTQPNNASDCN